MLQLVIVKVVLALVVCFEQLASESLAPTPEGKLLLTYSLSLSLRACVCVCVN